MSTTTTVTVKLIQNLSSFGYNIWLYKRPFDPATVPVQNILIGVLGVTKVPLQTVGQSVDYIVNNSFCIAASTPLAVGQGTQFGRLSTNVAYGDEVDFDNTLSEVKRIPGGAAPNSVLIKDVGSIAMGLAMTTPDGTLVAAENTPPGFSFMIQPNSYVYLVAEIGGTRHIGEVVSYDVVSSTAYQVDITGKSSVTVTLSANSEGAITWQTLAQTRPLRWEDSQLREQVARLEKRLAQLEFRLPVSAIDPVTIGVLVTAGLVWTIDLVYSYITSNVLKEALKSDRVQEIQYEKTSTGVKVKITYLPNARLEGAATAATPQQLFDLYKTDLINTAPSFSKDKVDFTIRLA